MRLALPSTGTEIRTRNNRVGASRLFDLSRIPVCPSVFLRRFKQPTDTIEKEDDNFIRLMKPDTVELWKLTTRSKTRKFGVRFIDHSFDFVRRPNNCGRNLWSAALNLHQLTEKVGDVWPVLGASLPRYQPSDRSAIAAGAIADT